MNFKIVESAYSSLLRVFVFYSLVFELMDFRVKQSVIKISGQIIFSNSFSLISCTMQFH